MERWTLAAPHSEQYRLQVASSGRGFYCRFDYAARPDPAAEGLVVVAVEGAGPGLVEWLPHLSRGMQAGWEQLRGEGRLLCGVRVELSAVWAHPTDTTQAGCALYAGRFVRELMSERCVQLAGSSSEV